MTCKRTDMPNNTGPQDARTVGPTVGQQRTIGRFLIATPASSRWEKPMGYLDWRLGYSVFLLLVTRSVPGLLLVHHLYLNQWFPQLMCVLSKNIKKQET